MIFYSRFEKSSKRTCAARVISDQVHNKSKITMLIFSCLDLGDNLFNKIELLNNSVEGLNVINVSKCNKILNVITFGTQCNKSLNFVLTLYYCCQ